jgi:hypothetical protein
MWLDKCWALRGHAIVWFASATFNGLSTRPDKLPICPIFWGSLTSEELETLSGAGLGRGFSWIFARHVRVPIFLSCKDRSTKPIGRAIFGARAFMLSGRYTWRGYAVSRFTPHRGSNSLWRSAVRRGQKKDIFGLEITRQKQTSPGRAVSVRPAPCGVKNTSIRPIPRRLLPSIDHQICKHHQRQALTRKAPVKSLSSIVPRSDSHVPNHRQFRPYAKPIPQSRDRVSSALAQSV